MSRGYATLLPVVLAPISSKLESSLRSSFAEPWWILTAPSQLSSIVGQWPTTGDGGEGGIRLRFAHPLVALLPRGLGGAVRVGLPVRIPRLPTK
jgi:hypothetical protein